MNNKISFFCQNFIKTPLKGKMTELCAWISLYWFYNVPHHGQLKLKTFNQNIPYTEIFSETIVLVIVTVIQCTDGIAVWCYQTCLWPWNQQSFCLASTPSVHQKRKIVKVSCCMFYWAGSCPRTICSLSAAGSFGCVQLLHFHCSLCVNLSSKKNWKKLPGPLPPPHLEEQLVEQVVTTVSQYPAMFYSQEANDWHFPLTGLVF